MICGTLPPDGERVTRLGRSRVERYCLENDLLIASSRRAVPSGTGMLLASKVGLARAASLGLVTVVGEDACGPSVDRGIANTASPMPNSKIAAIPAASAMFRFGARRPPAAGRACVAGATVVVSAGRGRRRGTCDFRLRGRTCRGGRIAEHGCVRGLICKYEDIFRRAGGEVIARDPGWHRTARQAGLLADVAPDVVSGLMALARKIVDAFAILRRDFQFERREDQ